jgi:hypothetical protein
MVSPTPNVKLSRWTNSATSVLANVVASRIFTVVTNVITILNFIFLIIQWSPMSGAAADTFGKVGIVLAAFFVAEAVLKVLGEGVRPYLASRWNRLDLVIALFSILALALSAYISVNLRNAVWSLRLLRLARIARSRRSLNNLTVKFGSALGSLGGVFAFMIIVYFFVSVLSVRIFGRLNWNQDMHQIGEGISRAGNFATVTAAIFAIYRLSYFSNWERMWFSSTSWAVGCEADLGNCGPVTPVPEIFYVVVIFAFAIIMRNLFIAVMVDAFASAGDVRAVTKPHARQIIEAWRKYDPDMTLSIRGFDVVHVLRAIPRECPIGFTKFESARRVPLEIRFLTLLRIADATARGEPTLPTADAAPGSRNGFVPGGVSFDAFVDLLCFMEYSAPAPIERALARPPFVRGATSTDLLQGGGDGMVTNDSLDGARYTSMLSAIFTQRSAGAYVTDEEAFETAIKIVFGAAALRLLELRRRRKAREMRQLAEYRRRLEASSRYFRPAAAAANGDDLSSVSSDERASDDEDYHVPEFVLPGGDASAAPVVRKRRLRAEDLVARARSRKASRGADDAKNRDRATTFTSAFERAAAAASEAQRSILSRAANLARGIVTNLAQDFGGQGDDDEDDSQEPASPSRAPVDGSDDAGPTLEMRLITRPSQHNFNDDI